MRVRVLQDHLNFPSLARQTLRNIAGFRPFVPRRRPAEFIDVITRTHTPVADNTIIRYPPIVDVLDRFGNIMLPGRERPRTNDRQCNVMNLPNDLYAVGFRTNSRSSRVCRRR